MPLLRRADIVRNEDFLRRASRSTVCARTCVRKADREQLRVLTLLLASVALGRVPAGAAVEAHFKNSRKKKLLRKHFSSLKKARALARDPETARAELSRLAPPLRSCLSILFGGAGGEGKKRSARRRTAESDGTAGPSR